MSLKVTVGRGGCIICDPGAQILLSLLRDHSYKRPAFAHDSLAEVVPLFSVPTVASGITS